MTIDLLSGVVGQWEDHGPVGAIQCHGGCGSWLHASCGGVDPDDGDAVASYVDSLLFIELSFNYFSGMFELCSSCR